MRILLQAPLPTSFKVTKASIAEFPALDGQSVSHAILQYPAGSVNPPHIHPRSAELFDANNSAIAISAFGSANAGTVSVPNSVFTTGIDDGNLAKSFNTDIGTIQKINLGLHPRPEVADPCYLLKDHCFVFAIFFL
ncbi:hypothetical protein SO802_009594 [Lithocarpus litseifolius]|uniref:Cupin type-1 domain-containing protein n=1 Tax=Lithocarpus litseifolius TaxID=425828 RepID=A0AAW2DBU8_9ROSI